MPGPFIGFVVITGPSLTGGDKYSFDNASYEIVGGVVYVTEAIAGMTKQTIYGPGGWTRVVDSRRAPSEDVPSGPPRGSLT